MVDDVSALAVAPTVRALVEWRRRIRAFFAKAMAKLRQLMSAGKCVVVLNTPAARKPVAEAVLPHGFNVSRSARNVGVDLVAPALHAWAFKLAGSPKLRVVALGCAASTPAAAPAGTFTAARWRRWRPGARTLKA